MSQQMSQQSKPQSLRSDPTKDWSRHEHVAPAVQNEAQRLVAISGSPELAKQAIDAAAQAPSPMASTQDAFAREQGFTSYLDLFEASTIVQTTDGRSWCVTALSDGQWLLWNERDLPRHVLYASLEAAKRAIPQD